MTRVHAPETHFCGVRRPSLRRKKHVSYRCARSSAQPARDPVRTLPRATRYTLRPARATTAPTSQVPGRRRRRRRRPRLEGGRLPSSSPSRSCPRCRRLRTNTRAQTPASAPGGWRSEPHPGRTCGAVRPRGAGSTGGGVGGGGAPASAWKSAQAWCARVEGLRTLGRTPGLMSISSEPLRSARGPLGEQGSQVPSARSGTACSHASRRCARSWLVAVGKAAHCIT